MEKRKNRLLVIGVIAALAAIAVGFWINSKHTSSEEKIAEAVASAWSRATAEDDPIYLQEIDKLSSYEIVDIEEGEYYTIHVVVRGIDLGSELENLLQDDFPQDEEGINSYLLEIIGRCPQVETATIIYAEPTEDGFDISFSDTFVDAMSGKIYSYYMNQIEDITGGA